MSRSSNGGLGRLGRPGRPGFRLRVRLRLAALILPLVLGPTIMPATAQEAAVDNVAFLVEQPARGSALPVLPANTLDYIAARYDLAGASVDVYVVPTPQVTAARTAAPPDDTVEAWQALACAGAPLEVWSASADTRPLSRTPRQGYTLYIAGPADDAARCSFAAGFAGTFEFFLAELDRSLTQGVPPEFPAVVTLD